MRYRSCAVLANIAPTEKLTVILDRNDGGDVDAALTIGDLIRNHRGPTIGRINQYANSAAIVVLAACSIRKATAAATFRMHQTAAARSHIVGRLTAGNLHRVADRLAAIDTRVRGYIAREIRCSVAELDRLEQDSAVLDAPAAWRLGLLTHIVGRTAPRHLAHRETRSKSEISPALLAKFRRHFGSGDRPIAMSSAFIRRLEAMP
jgi:ATP-dependent protease ClpP protease subunit